MVGFLVAVSQIGSGGVTPGADTDSLTRGHDITGATTFACRHKLSKMLSFRATSNSEEVAQKTIIGGDNVPALDGAHAVR